MKDRLENFWLIVQIIGGCGAILGGYVAWHQAQIEVIRPIITGKIGDITDNWFYEKSTDVCNISTHWEIENKGKDVVEVRGIYYEVYSIEDDSISATRGAHKDTSTGSLINGKNPLLSKTSMLPNTEKIGPAGIVSRDLSFNFYPDSDNPKEWFSQNRLAIKVTAEVDVIEKRRWCFFCPTEKDDAIVLSGPEYWCGNASNKSN